MGDVPGRLANGLPQAVDRELAELAKALGHPVRVRIMRLLLERPTCCCGDLVEELPLAQATVSQHLKVLRAAGLIQGTISGPRVRYCANRPRLDDLAELLQGLS
jgi:ArsR family transcriptional regulator, arsenate/arsenite/antimonite-responsive transcriptional repressor